jgi:hypothetical protein
MKYLKVVKGQMAVNIPHTSWKKKKKEITTRSQIKFRAFVVQNEVS